MARDDYQPSVSQWLALVWTVDFTNLTTVKTHVLGDGAPWATALLSLSYMGMMLRCIHEVGGHVSVQVKCIRCRCYVACMGWGGGMSTFRWSAYGVDATLHAWGGAGHVNVQVKCIRCRCYVAYMRWGGMLAFRWSAYGVDATLHTWGGVGACQRSGEVHTVSMLRCMHGVGRGMLTFRWSAYGVDATLLTWGGKGGMLTFRWSAYGADATLHTWGGGGMLTFREIVWEELRC